MQWEKLGKLFDPTQHAIADGCSLYAKAPQAIVLHDRVRIFYSAQKKTENGKYLSCPQYVDFTKSFDKILGLSQRQVIALGALGAFDEHGIFPMNVLRYEDKVLAYTSGWSRRVAVSIDMSIGFASSENDGESFVKYGDGGPIMSASHNEPFLVGDPFVQYLNGQFHMWYIFGTSWNRYSGVGEPERCYKIAHAVSNDGIQWERNGRAIISDRLAEECQALPTILFKDGRFHMYFCYRGSHDFRTNTLNAYRLGYAFSEDMRNWHRDDSQAGLDVSPNAWDSDMLCYPHLFECDDAVYLLYNGNEFGKYGFGIARLISIEP